MPSWCECMINVWGEAEELLQIVERAKSKGLCDSVIPIAEDADPYEAWGTNREVDLEEVDQYTEDDGRERLVLDFRSAWEPPIHVMKKLAERFEVEAWFVIKGESVGQVISDGKTPPVHTVWEDATNLSHIPEEEHDDLAGGLFFWLEDELEYAKRYPDD